MPTSAEGCYKLEKQHKFYIDSLFMNCLLEKKSEGVGFICYTPVIATNGPNPCQLRQFF